MVKKLPKRWESGKNLFALIVGIDKYQHAAHLRGAVNDADALDLFLKDHIQVADSRIINLRNESATRKSILDSFQAVLQNDSVRRDDPILVYFAGHGCVIPQPEGWEPRQETIRGIMPYDVQPQESSNRTILPIPERTILSWLERLSDEKGNNITVIFDACCSSSSHAENTRFHGFRGKLPQDIDDLNKGTHPEVIQPQSKGLRSHVLLTACSATEVAQEVEGRGVFTEALLDTLRKPGADKLSYTELMKALPRLDNGLIQTPQCIGHFRDRLIFSRQVQKMGLHFFPVCLHMGQRYKIEAGEAHGVTLGSLFDAYDMAPIKTECGKLVGTLCVQEIHRFEAIAILEPNGTETCTRCHPVHARQVRSGTGHVLHAHFSNSLLDVISPSDVLGDCVVLVDETHSDLAVDLEDTIAVFSINLVTITKHGFRRLPHSVPANSKAVSNILLAAYRWLICFNVRTRDHWIRDTHLEFFHLERDGRKVDEMGYIVLKPTDTKNLNRNKVVDIVVNQKTIDFYGIKLRNETPQNLYASLLIFDTSDLSIALYWTGDALPQPPLRAGCSITIGYGEGGGLPLCYQLPQGLDVDVGFLKVYLTTKPINLGYLEQDSPFRELHDLSFPADIQELGAEHQWGTITCTLVQRARP